MPLSGVWQVARAACVCRAPAEAGACAQVETARGTLIRGLILVMVLFLSVRASAQVRGVYPTGMNATNAGGIAEEGFSYSNLFLFNSRDRLKDADGQVTTTGHNAVMIDLNTLVWASRQTRLAGGRVSMAVTFLVSSNSLASDTEGPLSSGGGFADTYVQPFILGWQSARADARIGYGVLAPTGAFTAGAIDNVGSGYWTHAPNGGVTLFLTKDRGTAFAAYYLHEFHTVQEGTGIGPGRTANLDYSVTRTFPVRGSGRLQVGLAGYEQWQTSGKTAPGLAPDPTRYQANALGVASNLILPERRATLGLKYFREFANTSTFQGYTLHISAALGF